MKYLVDSNIIIYHLNNNATASGFLEKYHQEIAISQITYIEVLSFPFSKEELNLVDALLCTFKILDITEDIARQAVRNRQTKKIKVPDNIIASTAMVYQLTLVTRNTKDFTQLSIDIFNPFASNLY